MSVFLAQQQQKHPAAVVTPWKQQQHQQQQAGKVAAGAGDGAVRIPTLQLGKRSSKPAAANEGAPGVAMLPPLTVGQGQDAPPAAAAAAANPARGGTAGTLRPGVSDGSFVKSVEGIEQQGESETLQTFFQGLMARSKGTDGDRRDRDSGVHTDRLGGCEKQRERGGEDRQQGKG
ncbi:hypothetical protein Efla_002259 [Eimeria flavescens]